MKPTAITSATCRAALLLALAFPAWSQTAVEPAPATAAVPTGKLVTSYSDFAGSPDNASSLVNGLRTGTPVTLTDPALPGGPPPATTTFTPPTRPMGYGNIRIALSLAKAQLASQGITNPTASELQGAMMGTTNPDGTTTQGILQMRAEGMGWGKIANTMGFKLGAVMSGKQTYAAAAAGSTTTASGTAATHGRSSVTTAAGGTATGAGKSKGVVTGAGNAGGQGHSKGIVTAAGASGGGAGVTTGLGHGHASASGAVNAAGGQAGSHAGGNGHGKGGGKP